MKLPMSDCQVMILGHCERPSLMMATTAALSQYRVILFRDLAVPHNAQATTMGYILKRAEAAEEAGRT